MKNILPNIGGKSLLCEMIVQGDPTFIPNKDQYFMSIAQTVAKGSNHPIAPGGCIIARGS